MGKKKDKEKEHKEHGSPSRKKLKKHKKQKKQKKRDRVYSDEEIDVVNDDTSQDEGKALKLKIKFAGKTLSEVVTTVQQPAEEIEKTKGDDLAFNSDELPDDEETQPEEAKSDDEKWLDALEKGELDETGSVKKEKDISVMTARQRALHGEAIEGENELLQLPMYPQKNEEENEEFERKRKLRAKKRKQQMEKQVEETKAQTIEKLLTKGQKTKKDVAKTNKNSGPYFRYSSKEDGIFISCPEGCDFPLVGKVAVEPPKSILCSIEGCSNQKKYACSTSKRPVCSLQCYKLINR